MAVQTKTVLKTYFETGDRPTEGEFVDLIDSFVHVDDTPAAGLARTVDTPAAIGAASVSAIRLGGEAAVTFAGSGAAGYTIGIPSGAELLRLTFLGNSTTANGTGELVLAVDNGSGNNYDRFFAVSVYDLTNGQLVNVHALGLADRQTTADNITTITIPNIGGNFPNGVRVILN